MTIFVVSSCATAPAAATPGIVAYPPQHAPHYAGMAMHGPTIGHYPVPLQHHQPYPHYQAAAAAAAAAAANAAPSVHMQQLMEQQAAEELRKSAKRAANRRSASTCRARKKFLVENMAEANSRMRKRSRVLSLLPDMILAMRRDGIITYASENCRQFLKFTREVRDVPLLLLLVVVIKELRGLFRLVFFRISVLFFDSLPHWFARLFPGLEVRVLITELVATV